MRLPAALVQRWSDIQLNFSAIARAEIAGNINTAAPGTIVAGRDFTIVRNGVGDVTVTFARAFPVVPVVTVSAGATGAMQAVKIHNLGPPTRTGFRLFSASDMIGTALDGLVAFRATAP